MAGPPPLLALFVFSPCAGVLAALFGLMVYDHDGPWLQWGPASVLTAWALVALYGTLSAAPRSGMSRRWSLIATCAVLASYAGVLWWIVGHLA